MLILSFSFRGLDLDFSQFQLITALSHWNKVTNGQAQAGDLMRWNRSELFLCASGVRERIEALCIQPGEPPLSSDLAAVLSILFPAGETWIAPSDWF